MLTVIKSYTDKHGVQCELYAVQADQPKQAKTDQPKRVGDLIIWGVKNLLNSRLAR